MEKGLAIITGADGGMGQVITAALAKEGYPVIMACLDPEKAASLCNRIQQETGNTQIEVRRIDLASLSSVNNFTGQLLKERTSRQPLDEQCRHPDNSGTQNRRRAGNNRKRQLCGSLHAHPPVITINATRMPYCKYSVLHVCHRPDRTGLL